MQPVGSKLYVTFASIENTHGGVVDVFNTDGDLLTPNHFAANAFDAGPLENPWGIIQAPANFGAYSHDLLIGNVAGAGNINVYNPSTGAYLGQLDQPDGSPIAITGLWDLQFGDGTPQGGETNQLFFAAGPNAPGVSINGLFGVIQPAGHQGGKGGGDTCARSLELAFGSTTTPPAEAGSSIRKALRPPGRRASFFSVPSRPRGRTRRGCYRLPSMSSVASRRKPCISLLPDHRGCFMIWRSSVRRPRAFACWPNLN